MVNIEQSIVSDAPHILREILQNKENRFNDLEKAKADIMQETHIASLNVEHDKTVNDLNGGHSGHSDQSSVSGSDEESSFLDQSRIDETEVDDAKSDADEMILNGSPPENKEVKRARVESILTSIQQPPQFVDMEAMYGMNEVRRQKRKQNIPQQHETSAKIRKLDGHPFDEDYWSLGHQLNQIHAMRNYFKQYDNAPPKPMNGYGGLDNIQRLQQAYFANSVRQHNEDIQRQMMSPQAKLPACTPKERTVTDDHFSIAEHVRETVSANKGLSQGVADLDDKELNELIGNLKSKIEEAVSLTVDKELGKFFQKRNNNTKDTKDSKPKDNMQSLSASVDRLFKKDETQSNQENRQPEPEKKTTDHSLNHILQMPAKPAYNGFRIPDRHSAFELPKLTGVPEMPRPPFPHHPPLGYPPLSFYLPSSLHATSPYSCPVVSPEQTEALSLVVNTPKKKRTKVTDTRLSPRAARALLHDNVSLAAVYDHERSLATGFNQNLLNTQCLPTSVAIPNPSLHHSDILNFYKDQSMCSSPIDNDRNTPSSNSPSEGGYSYMKGDFFNDSDSYDAHGKQITDTLTPMHLRKAKLMFFYVRYPSSAILKVYFPDVQFNKNNTAQLVKWFSNFREFYYIQMEKYARQAIAEGCKHADDISVTTDSELYRVLNLHYNRNNQIEVPAHFREAIQNTLREFFVAVLANKDAEPSWKKPIYKVIARMDDVLPEYFKSPNWMDQLGDS